MGLADRDYARDDRRPATIGSFQPLTVTTWLIVINVAVHVLDIFLPHYLVTLRDGTQQFAFLELWGHFSIYTAIQHLQIWRFVTFQFLHANFNHILFNMFTLYFMGPLIEAYLGRRRFLAFYLLCGVGGPIAYVLLWSIGVWGVRVPSTISLVGASAGIFGVLVAAATVAPDATVLVMGAIPAKLKTVAWVLIGLAVYTVFSRGNNAGGEAAHLGGAVIGFFLIRRPGLLNVFEYGYRSSRPRRGR